MEAFESLSVIIQARLSSTRMPGKVIQYFIGTQSILDIQIKNLQDLKIPILLATTTNPKDDALEELVKAKGVHCYRGSEQDVLGRFIAASDADYMIRVCSDNPFLDTSSIPTFLNKTREDIDYISFQNVAGVPAIRTHWGLFTEIVSRRALVEAHRVAENHSEGAFYREHVTNYIYDHQDKFNVKLIDAPEIIKDRDDLRFTIDTPEDFENMQKLYRIIENEGGDFSLENLVRTTDAHKEIKKVMADGIARFNK